MSRGRGSSSPEKASRGKGLSLRKESRGKRSFFSTKKKRDRKTWPLRKNTSNQILNRYHISDIKSDIKLDINISDIIYNPSLSFGEGSERRLE
ncbi:MAG: hypothetical protein KHW62_01195 [Clostridiales bacterium]|nr:hypothetical protein [Clostridiales bacterium]